MDYSKTLNLPKTSFSMKANLRSLEPKILEFWQSKEIYQKINFLGRSSKYILHDGPPYANGKIHIGHALNKILKDIVIKYKALRGYSTPFIPGWDCHGLPVEIKLLEELKEKKDKVNQIEFRRKAKDFALKYVDIQRKDFIRLGVFADWENPYLTLNPKYEAKVLRLLADLVKAGYLYRGLKPVNWCLECTTALAEAEVEYKDKVSDSIYVKFKLKDDIFKGEDVYIVVWTTTPWTLISNTALALHPDLDYLLVKSLKGNFIFLESLADNLRAKLFKEGFQVIRRIKGKELEKKRALHPFLERDSLIILADFVSSEEGSGCVHIAPGHGEEDFQVGKLYNLPVIMPVDEKGYFQNCGDYSGLRVTEINPILIEKMRELGTLLLAEKITHTYPHCWRCKNPLIFRATEQWFLSLEAKNLRERVLKAIEEVNWFPPQGKERISSMVSLRPDWCLSRQRLWGVPIPALRCKGCGEVILEEAIIRNFSKIVEERGSDAWFEVEVEEITDPGFNCKCGSRDFEKEKDILDVWFESGASFYAVVKESELLNFPSDLYLEGSDQHRGWFQVSLIPSVALEDKAPFRGVLTHGFVVDLEARKMSKSLGNIISPQQIIEKYGAEILRMWAVFSDYTRDVSLSEEILSQIVEAYRKVRNTLRFILANLYDFNFREDLLTYSKLLEVDKLFLSLTANLLSEVEAFYDNFLFYKVYQKIYEFCNITLSSFYLDILKDRLYTFQPASLERRSAQTSLYYIFNFLIKAIAPILSFTAEEAYTHFQEQDKKESVFLSNWPNYQEFKRPELESDFKKIFKLRDDVLKALEEERSKGLIGSSLEAEVKIVTTSEDFNFLKEREDLLREFFIVSKVEVEKGESFSLKVEKAKGKKCLRCWNWREDVGKDKDFEEVCLRCVSVLRTQR